MLLEIASTGKPIVASNIPANTQIFAEDEVLYFENKDVNDLSEKLRWIEKNRQAFNAFGLRAKIKVVSKYTWDRVALEYISLYNSMD
jgi:glycosyltransferase involved in cell wall biosynthesis